MEIQLREKHKMFIVLYNLYDKNAESALPLLCYPSRERYINRGSVQLKFNHFIIHLDLYD